MKNIFTIPNIISFFRLLLIPFFVILYFKEAIPNHYWWATLIVIVSGLSDIIDGFIARHYNMVSDLGKLLDPIADKLTQAVIILCLAINHLELLPMFAVLFVKELLTLFAAVHLLSNGTKPISSKWFGKLSTVVLFLAMIYTLIIDLFATPNEILYVLIVASIVCMIISIGGYFKLFSTQVKGVSDNDEVMQ